MICKDLILSKIMKKIIPNFRIKNRHIFPNLPAFGPILKTMRKNTGMLCSGELKNLTRAVIECDLIPQPAL